MIIIITSPVGSHNFYSKYSDIIPAIYQPIIDSYKKILDKEENYLKPLWLKLIHYKKNSDGYESELDSKNFFLSFFSKKKEFPIGKWNPRIEFLSTFESFFADKRMFFNIELHPICAFPARFKYIKKLLKESRKNPDIFPKVECKVFDLFLKEFHPESLSYLFASYYLGAPASIFGHTFLKINSREGREDILNYSINYAANPGDIDIFRYIFYGLFGGFKGYYSVLPYHIKVNEYNDIEERDLWEYELNLSDEQIDWILKHLWEVANFGYMDYFYATENCSYQILTLLHVGLPDKINFIESLNGIVIPTETVKILNQLGLFKKRMYRPSLKSQILQRYYFMNSYEKNYFHILESNQLIPYFSLKSENINYLYVYDTLLLYYKFKKIKNKLGEEDSRYYKSLLLERVNYPPDKNHYDFEPLSTTIEEAHSQSLLSLEIGFVQYQNKNYNIYELSFRYLYHDFLNDPVGFPEFSELENFYLHLRYDTQLNQFFIYKFKFMNLYSLNPVNQLFFLPSYHIEAGYKNQYLEMQKINTTRLYLFNYFYNDAEILLLNKKSIFYDRDLKIKDFTYILSTWGISVSGYNQNLSILGGGEVNEEKFSLKAELLYIFYFKNLNFLLSTGCNWYQEKNFCLIGVNLSYLINKDNEIRIIYEREHKISTFKLKFVYLF